MKVTTSNFICKKPYSYCIIPDVDRFIGYVREFPGCIVEGTTIEEAFTKLCTASEQWTEDAINLGQDVPGPITKIWAKEEPPCST